MGAEDKKEEEEMISSSLFDAESSDSSYTLDSEDEDVPCGTDGSVAGLEAKQDPVTCRKYIVWAGQLDELFTHCRKCHMPVTSVEKSERASLLSP